MFLHYRTFRPKLGLLPRVLLAGAIAAVLILATVGAVIGVALLAVGALVHAVVRQFRAPQVAAGASNQSAHAIIDGEFVVVSDSSRPRPTLPAGAEQAR